MSINLPMCSPTRSKYVDPRALALLEWDSRLPRHTDLHLQIIEPGTLPTYSKDTKELGEIVFGMGYIQNYCEKKGKSVDKELERLTVHGMCHILGYDHEEDPDYEKMHAREMAIMRKLKELRKEEINDGKREALYSPSSDLLTTSDAENALVEGEKEAKEVKKKLVKRVKKSTAAKVAKPKKKKKDDSSSSSSSDSSSSSSSSSS